MHKFKFQMTLIASYAIRKHLMYKESLKINCLVEYAKKSWGLPF